MHDDRPDPRTSPGAGHRSGDETVAASGVPGSADPMVGARVGRYLLQRPLGEGGMGAVYLAEQQEPVRRLVAMKMIKLGLDTRAFVTRFEAERQALALMDHSGIARVLDAGATDQGRPYYVMEYVPGFPLTEYCERHRLTVAERLRLFMRVCDAIQHAHQKAIIHRDLKPSNVLVIEQDGEPVPKIIDFGLAKALADPLTDASLLTGVGQVLGTPAYMSPEQAALDGDGGGVDTRTDVYALGMILYELLTGLVPFDLDAFQQSGLEEKLRIIREVEPPRPSSRLRASGDLATDHAGRAGTDPRRLAGLLSGDLDWITMKALEKDPARRYDTVRGLARDLDRFLHDEPTEASPPSTTYRLGKFVRRNRRGVAAGVLTTGALAVFAVVMAVQAGVIDRARDRAELEAEKARAVNAYLQEVLVASDPWSGGEREITVREALDRSAATIDETFAGQPVLEATVRSTLGSTYSGMGSYHQAEEQYRQALALRLAQFGPDHDDVGKAWQAMASAHRQLGETEEALAASTEALRVARRNHGERSLEFGACLESHGRSLLAAGRHAEADSLATLGLDVLATLPDDTGRRRAELLRLRASLAHRWRGDVAAADSLLTIAVALHRGLDPQAPITASTINDLALVKTIADDYDLALALYQESLAINRVALGEDHPEVAIVLENMGGVYYRQGRWEETLALLQQVLEIRTRGLGPQHMAVGRTMFNLALTTLDSGDPEAAIPLFREALAIGIANQGDQHVETAHMRHYLGETLTDQGQLDEALTLLETAVAIAERDLAPEHGDLAMMRHELGRIHLRRGEFEAAALRLRQAYQVRRATLREGSSRTRRTAALLVEVYAVLGWPEDVDELRRVAELD